MKTRQATREEILEYFQKYEFQMATRISFETGAREVLDKRTESGVRHITRGSSLPRIINGEIFVKRHGNLVKLYATHITLDSGTTLLAGFTIIPPR